MTPPQRHQTSIIWLLAIIGLTGLIAIPVFLRLFVFEARYIPSGSMEPTLQVNDRLLIDKWVYRFAQPQRGDIVVFHPTERLMEKGFEAAFIARVIGMPGDRVEVKDQRLRVNGKPLAEPYLPEESQILSIEACYFEGEAPFLERPQTVSADHYLMLGDNRNNSFDGRCWGLVPREKLIGKAVRIFYPFNRSGDILTPSYP